MKDLLQVFSNALAYTGRLDAEGGEAERAWISVVQERFTRYIVNPCRFVMDKTGEGIHSGRPAYKVECALCKKVLHEQTTGPVHQINKHIEDRLRDLLEPE